MPVPLTETVTGFSSGSLDGISKESLKSPVAVGSKVTVQSQLCSGVKIWLEQLTVIMLKEATRGLSLAITPSSRFSVPSFVIVTVASADSPSVTLPNGT